jgi:hypothetical protein
MKKFILFLFLFLSLYSVSALAQEWELMGKTDAMTWEYLKGSLLLKKDQTGEVFWTVQFRIHPNVANPTIEFKRLAVSLRDCLRGEGKLLFINTEDTVDGKVEFLVGGGTAASNIAESICIAGKIYMDKLDKLDKHDETPKYKL